ncbi:MAG: alpha/beta fold hydrolase [Janthinobacterium lividum]
MPAILPARRRPLSSPCAWLLALGLSAAAPLAARAATDAAASPVAAAAITTPTTPAATPASAVAAAAITTPMTPAATPASAVPPAPNASASPAPRPGGAAAAPARDDPSGRHGAMGIGFEGLSYPYPVHFLALRNEGQDVRMAYMDVPPAPVNGGEPGAGGRTIVLLHGKNFGGAYWENVIRHLAARGYRVIVPDQIGFGKSSKPELAYSFDLLARNTIALLDALQIAHADVLGHSTGGMLAMRITLDYPARVDRLLLEDPIGLEDYRRLETPQTTETLYRAQLDMTPDAYRLYVKGYFAHWSERFEAPLVAPYLGAMQSGEYPRLAKTSALTSQMIFQQPLVDELPDIAVPTLLIVGEKDRTAPGKAYARPDMKDRLGNFPMLGRAAARAIPHCRLVVIPDVGHIAHWEAPSAFFSAVDDFLF